MKKDKHFEDVKKILVLKNESCIIFSIAIKRSSWTSRSTSLCNGRSQGKGCQEMTRRSSVTAADDKKTSRNDLSRAINSKYAFMFT